MAFPQSPLPVTGELYLGPAVGWLDVTADLRLATADSGGGITITRGKANEGNQADPGSTAATLNNKLGKYSPRNPMSDLFGLLGRNTPLRVGVALVIDPFSRSVASGLGASPDGHTWSNLGGAVGDYAVITGMGRHAQPVKNVIRVSRMDQDWTDIEQVTEFSIPAVAVGASAVVGHVARYQVGSGEHYWLRLEFDVGGAISCKIARYFGGVWTELAVGSAIPGLSYTAGQSWTLRSSVSGSALSVRAWPTGTPEPDTWLLRTADRGLLTPGRGGIASWVVSGNTNTTEVRFDNYQAINRRVVHEVTALPQRWDVSGKDRWTPITAAGILRRLGQGTSPSRSPLRRAISASSPAAYWPGEDGDAASQAGSAIPGHPPLKVTGTVTFAAVEDYTNVLGDTSRYGTAALADLAAGGMIAADVPADVTAATATRWTVVVTAGSDVTVASADVVLAEMSTPGSTFVRWQLVQRKATLRTQVVAYNAAGASTLVVDDPSVSTSFNQFDVSVWQNGASINAGIFWDGSSHGVTGSVAGTLSGVSRIAVNTGRTTQSVALPVGHLAVWPAAQLPAAVAGEFTDGYSVAVSGPGVSYEQETATDRLVRLCAEEGVPLDMPAVPVDAVQRMGWQPVGTFSELLAACVQVDGGLLFEARDQLGLAYRPRYTLYNQTPLELSYSGGHIAEPFEPVDDDDQVANDITVSRKDGSSVRAVQTTGRLAAVPPPAGVGVYESSVELNLLADDQLPDQTGWRLHLGTVDESRYPRVRANLATSAWSADPALTAQASALDSGDLEALGGLPAWLPPGPAQALVQGYTEKLDAYDWDITWNASPGSPWDVATADGMQRAPAHGSTLAAALTDVATKLLLASTVENGVWSEDPTDFPLAVRVGGEQVTASAIQPALVETFSRTLGGGWGTPDSSYVGGAWTVAGTASEYSVVGGTQARMALVNVNDLHVAHLDVGSPDHDVFAPAAIPVVPTGAGITVRVGGRMTDTSNYYEAQILIATSGAVTLQIFRRVAGVGASVTSAVAVGTHSAGNTWTVGLSCRGSGLRAKAWRTTDAQPDWQVSGTDTSLTSGTRVACMARREASNTNGSVNVDWPSASVPHPQAVTLSARAVNGIVRAWSAGTEVDVWAPAIAPL